MDANKRYLVALLSLLCATWPLPSHSAAARPVTQEFGLQWAKNYTGVSNIGYTALSPVLPGQMVLSRFQGAPLFGKSHVSLLDLKSGAVRDLADNIKWPNEATVVDEDVFGFKAVLVGSGFLVPSYTTGGIWVLEVPEDGEPARVLKDGPVKITKDRDTWWKPDSGWFYHRAQMVDMNGDGRMDVLTSRCQYSVEPWNGKHAKLVWLEQPTSGAFDGEPWVEHELIDGPDFLFAMKPQNATAADNALVTCAAEYVSERLEVVFGHSGKDAAKPFTSRVVDPELGPGFGCTWEDLNGDGQLDLLATNHLNRNGSVTAYSWEGDLADPSVRVHKHTLASGFNAATTSTGTASPGDAIPFHVRTGDNAGKKPLLLVSADNGNYIAILVPDSANDPGNWSYTETYRFEVGADVGRISIGDQDGDGLNELFVPAFDFGYIVHLKFLALAQQ